MSIHEDEDGIDGPFDRAMKRAMRDDAKAQLTGVLNNALAALDTASAFIDPDIDPIILSGREVVALCTIASAQIRAFLAPKSAANGCETCMLALRVGGTCSKHAPEPRS